VTTQTQLVATLINGKRKEAYAAIEAWVEGDNHGADTAAFLLEYLEGRQRRYDRAVVILVLGVSVMLTLGLFALGQLPDKDSDINAWTWITVANIFIAVVAYGLAFWAINYFVKRGDAAWRLSLRVRAALLAAPTEVDRGESPLLRWLRSITGRRKRAPS
jgi:multisubunit Na+/H+ antiporter MnhG subunit